MKVTLPAGSMRTKAFGAKSAFDSTAIAALSRGMETLRIRPPPAAAVAFSIVRRVGFGREEVEVMSPVSFRPTGRLA
jgi:hypothetical protein